ncbi:thrombospondin type 3 repeat-containing protein [Paraliomyxa miuraensis]|uniref:thrombospondin type 3 repeat-containing protein n=1 Tax=Paraliomyxa miuraensis TaxID=376150 RepID=UPI002255F8E7|nr:thrombospondin type 3 repeat-containing protein [Paraliomyxa miuraensis]MCX4246938.1 thrombospondin type 3 repeat-containing protein [Paraliomyxa miuraensis]
MTNKAAKGISGARRMVAGALLLTGVSVGATGCIEDSDCGICDPDNLVLESISGINYASRKINVLNPQCEGSDCPADFSSGSYFIQEIGPCEETEQALESPRGTEEFCKISPLVTAFGIEFVFNNLLDPTSIELVRKRPDNPQLFEVYDWKHQVLEIEGPITRFNGDFVKGATEEPDLITRLVNLSCIDNLRGEGIAFDHTSYEDPTTNPCNAVGPNGLPRKMQEQGTFKSYPGRWTVGGSSCDTPEEGPDTCCSRCDFLLSTGVAKYGLTGPAPEGASLRDLQDAGLLRNPNAGTAILCDPTLDIFSQCADFIPWTDRSEQDLTYEYYWDCPPSDPSCEPGTYATPYYDRLRETFPSDRPGFLERANVPCTSNTQCRSENGRDLPGTDCIGRTAEGVACSPEADPENCTGGTCVAEWFVTCRTDTQTLGDADPSTEAVEGYCADQRFSDRGAGACLRSRASFDALCDENGNNCSTAPANTRLAFCDHNEDGTMVAAECCQASLQDGLDSATSEACDPFFQNVRPVGIYDRNDTLPENTKNCICPSGGTTWGNVQGDEDFADCLDAVRVGCFEADDIASNGDSARAREERANQYAVKFVSRVGGVVYDPAIKGFEWRPADVGGVPRADIESCAEDRGLIGQRNIEDGWRANDTFAPENIEDYDRGLCSGSEYTVHFKVPEDGGQFVQDKVGNTLAGKASYTFQTPEFHVEPGSGFPSDNLRIGACNDFSIRFSNKYDMSPENLEKIQIWQIDRDLAYPNDFITLIAGGAGCAETKEELEANDSLVPCITVDVGNQAIGEVGLEIDPTVFGPVLDTGISYRVWVPGLSSRSEMSDPVKYQQAFWDVCGMPLITGGASTPDHLYDFTVDQPKCKEDQDLDTVQLSCDNAPDFFNPDQGDIDRDGFGDVIDLCPTRPGSSDDTADSDDDGVGNECDTCRQASRNYNEDDAAPMGYMTVRNIPFQDDSDQDGIGDVCDNCVLTPNCEEYGPSNPWSIGDPIEYDDGVLCQLDANANMVGDVCDGTMPNDFAAGPIGLGPDDDFDQDGLSNVVDACPRQPVALTQDELITCMSDADCPTSRKCETAFGVCDHLDTDGDGVGNVCDTCPFTENPLQVADGAMQEGDDTDGDFIGNACETHSSCERRTDSRPFSFYEYAANGYCCTVQLFEGDNGDLFINLPPRADGEPQPTPPLLDPTGAPVRVECSETDEDAGVCRKLPTTVAVSPGVLTPPEGCDEVLAGIDPRDNPKLTPEDVGDDLEALWDKMCFLPPWDQDYDGLGDKCDLCEFDFDPENLPFIDANGRVWPNDGKFCNGEFSVENKPACKDEDEPLPTGGETEGGSGDSGGSGGSGGGSGSGG